MDTKRPSRVTIATLQPMKHRKEVFAALSIYDAMTARLFDKAGGEVIIVGDSAAMTMEGRRSTLPMTMDRMISYAQSVRNGTPRLFVVGDMPLGSYEPSDELAVRNALRFVQEADCNAVKIETNHAYVSRIKAVANACLVVAHLGLNPNKAEQLGGYRTQGKDVEAAKSILDVAKVVEDAGACMILLESVIEEVAQWVRRSVQIPVFGIAAGRELDGQLLISSDLLGLYEWPGTAPVHVKSHKSSKKGMTVGKVTLEAFAEYVREVKESRFPGEGNIHCLTHIKDEGVREKLRDLVKA